MSLLERLDRWMGVRYGYGDNSTPETRAALVRLLVTALALLITIGLQVAILVLSLVSP